MAADHIGDFASMENSARGPRPAVCREKHSLLVVVGQPSSEGFVDLLVSQIERGLCSWDVDSTLCNLDEQLKLFISRHSAFVSEDLKGQKTLQHQGDVLETQVIVNPSHDLVCSEVRRLVSDASFHKLLILAGQCVEGTGDLVLQTGTFSVNDFLKIYTDEEVGDLQSSEDLIQKAKLTLSCPDFGMWKTYQAEKHNLKDYIEIKTNPPLVLPQMEGLQEFTEYLSESLEPLTPFDLLVPPSTVGFLKLSRPCCYVFPGGRGDCAFFAVSGFNVLVNGGSDARSCFWKLVRHLDRVDSVLLTHAGIDNLPGINSLFHRKVAEQKGQESQGNDWQLISPEIGVVFLNASERLKKCQSDPKFLRNSDQVALTLQHLERLSISPEPLIRSSGPTLEPVTLFQKMGVGRLELYVLNPVKGTKELEMFLQTWPSNPPSIKPSAIPLESMVSICALLVWHPANPREKIIRVLFPGCTPQAKIFEGLEKLKHLEFLKHPVICLKDLESSKLNKQPKRAESKESLKSISKEFRPPSASLKDKVAKVDLKKEDTKTKSKPVTDSVPKEKKESEEKVMPKDDMKQKLPKTEKQVTKKEPVKDEKKEVRKKEERPPMSTAKKDENVEKKKELLTKGLGAKPKKDIKSELKKEIKKEVKTEDKKASKHTVKDVKKSTGNLPGSAESRKSIGKNGVAKKGSIVHKKDNYTKGKPKQNQTDLDNVRSSSADHSNVFTPEKLSEQLKMDNEHLSLQDVEGNKMGTETESGFASKNVQVNGSKTSGDEGPEIFYCVELVPDSNINIGPQYPLAKGVKSVNFDLVPVVLDGCLNEEVCTSQDDKALKVVSPLNAGKYPQSSACKSPSEDYKIGIKKPGLGLDENKTGFSKNSSNNTTSSSILSSGSLKDTFPDGSLTITSFPAEVGSPHSTELDTSFSVSLEQVPVSQEDVGSIAYTNGHLAEHNPKTDLSLPLRSDNHLFGPHNDILPHDVDLCLVSPCEFKHHKTLDNQQELPTEQCKSTDLQDTTSLVSTSLISPSGSDVPPATEECPSITAYMDSDEDSSDTFPQHHLHDSPSSHTLCLNSQHVTEDPPPAPMKDLPPLPPQPGTCMADPEVESKSAKNVTTKTKRTAAMSTTMASSNTQTSKSRTGALVSASGTVRLMSSLDTRPPSRNVIGTSRTMSSRSSSGSVSTASSISPVYLDLAYLPSGSAASAVDAEFFRCLRSSCYIISGDEPSKDTVIRSILDALLEAKAGWPDVPVTLIPTCDWLAMVSWYQETHERQRDLNITALGSNSTVAMQDETFPACKVEF